MSSYRFMAGAFSLCMLLAPTVTGQGRNLPDIKTSVLNLLFPSDVASKPYHAKFVMRFGDSDTELIVLLYPPAPRRQCEIVRYGLEDLTGAEINDKTLAQLLSNMVKQNPHLSPEEIAANVKLKTTRSEAECQAIDRALTDLKAIRISPFFSTRVAVDEYSQYDYWFDAGQESVHYTITGPFKGDSQDQLVQWMIKFRASFDH